ncbi:MAG: phosphotransferase family protein [Acidobacteriaceae bacterium]
MPTFIDSKKQVPQDWAAIASYLQRRGKTLDLDAPIRQFASGIANLNYLVSLDGKPAVFRCPPDSEPPPGVYDFARQFKVLSRLGRCLPTTPLGLAYCEDKSVIGVPFLISEFRQGIAISRVLPEEFKNVEDIGAKLGALIIGTLARLHRISPADAGLADLGKSEGFVERQVGGWHRRASRVMQGEALAKVVFLTDWLTANLPVERPSTLVHLDFKLDNVLIDPATLTVQGVVDWEMATIGDPYFDLMLMLSLWGEPGDHLVYARQWSMPCESPGWWTRRQALDAYRRESGTHISEADIKFYWLLAMLRNVGALAQLIALYERTPMPNASVIDMPAVLASTLDHAVALTTKPLDW